MNWLNTCKEVIVETHNDLDAAGTVIVVTAAKIKIKRVMYNTYQTIETNLAEDIKQKNVPVLITDICPSHGMCDILNTVPTPIALFDHHKTRKFVKDYEWATFDTTKCGTELAYDALKTRIADKNPEHYVKLLEKLVLAIAAWDMWKKESEHRPRGEQLNSLIGFIGTRDFVDKFSINPDMDNVPTVKQILHYIEERKQRYIDQVIKKQLQSITINMDGYGNKFVILVATEYISELGDAVLNNTELEDIDYVCIINPTLGTCSLRSRSKEETDVANIAKIFGGGGHKSAAGFPTDLVDLIKEIVIEKLNKLNY